MIQETSLANNLLIAMPSMTLPQYKKSVIYICENHSHGSLGLIINRPIQHALGWMFKQMDIVAAKPAQNNYPLLFGGPLQPERGFVIHRPMGVWRSSLLLQEGVTVTTSNDIIHALATDVGPKDALVTLGYTGWYENQLEQEVKESAWLVCPYKSELLYEVPFNLRWEYAGSLLGIKMDNLSGVIGHA